MKLAPHEETLVLWWKVRDSFEHWMNVSHRCAGAASACADFPNGTRAAIDYAEAGALALHRALMAPVTPAPARVSQLEAAA